MLDALLADIGGWLSGALPSGAGPFAPLLALAAGVLTSFLPCSLSAVPLIIAYVGGVGAQPRRAWRLSLVFAAGSALTFTAFGAAAALLGRFLGGGGTWWYLVLGTLMALMALQTWGIINILPSGGLNAGKTGRGYLGALLAGLLAGVFSTPCATPVLVALLALVAGRGSLLWGVLLLLCYALGHGALAVLAGSGVGFVQKLRKDPRYGSFSRILQGILGALMLLLALYMFWLGF